MESDSDSSEDYEEQMNDLKKLSAALENVPLALDSTSIDSGESEENSNHKIHHELARIESALSLNRIMEQKYKRLEELLTLRLDECCKKLAENNKEDLPSTSTKNEPFRYYTCGKPYFKDKHNTAPPDNEDTKTMKISGMYDFTSVLSVPGWTVRDKSLLINTLHEMSQDLRKSQLTSQLSKLRRQKASKKEIDKIHRELANVQKKSLSDLALPIDEEYDWDNVATILHNRHSAQEYRALWKLFFHPTINKSGWTKMEHQKLKEIAVQYKEQDWDAIAKALNTGRTGYQTFVYYRTNMNNKSENRKWSKEEVEYLKRLVDYYREDNYIPWGKVASAIENRTKIQVYNKYLRVEEQRKGRFLAEEDSVILNCVTSFGLNFRRMAKYLPGRSSVQLRTRYNLLSKMRISTTWSVDDDKKLLQIMANQDSAAIFATATKHFPGKDRTNIRTRYNTLLRWMKANPNVDISLAPRRAARRLVHGKPNNDLKKSVEKLKFRMENEVIKTIKSYSENRIHKHSPEANIEEGIMQTIYIEILEQEEKMKQQQKSENEIVKFEGVHNKKLERIINMNNLKNVLIFFNAKLDKTKFLTSGFTRTYPELVESIEPDQLQLKSYSKKQTAQPTTFNQDSPDIWGQNPLQKDKNVLPPNLATITGCRVLMNHITKTFTTTNNDINISLMSRENDELKDCLTALKLRFTELFLWPILLSNASPLSDEDKLKKIPQGVVPYTLTSQLHLAKQPQPSTSTAKDPVDTDSDSQVGNWSAVSDFSSTDEDDL